MRQRAELAAVVVGGVALAGWEGAQPWPTAAAHWSVAAVILATVLVAVLFGRGRQPMATGPWLSASAARLRAAPVGYRLGVVVWVVVLAATIGWDLASFAVQAHQLPTLSYLTGRVTRYQLGRSAVFAGWLALGGYLALGRRR